jgi:hypothetical protein
VGLPLSASHATAPSSLRSAGALHDGSVQVQQKHFVVTYQAYETPADFAGFDFFGFRGVRRGPEHHPATGERHGGGGIEQFVAMEWPN